jgi:hypothetical protein
MHFCPILISRKLINCGQFAGQEPLTSVSVTEEYRIWKYFIGTPAFWLGQVASGVTWRCKYRKGCRTPKSLLVPSLDRFWRSASGRRAAKHNAFSLLDLRSRANQSRQHEHFPNRCCRSQDVRQPLPAGCAECLVKGPLETHHHTPAPPVAPPYPHRSHPIPSHEPTQTPALPHASP